MIPLIDIVFLLLVFFIYAMISMAVHRGVDVVLPKTETGQVEARMPIMLTLTADGAIMVEDRQVDREEVARAVMLLRAERSNAPVLISGDEGAELGPALQILDLLRLAGVGRVTFLTERKAGE